MQSARCSSLLPLFFGSGIMAIVDAAIQSANVGSEVFAAVLSFNLLGAWMICALFCLISTVLSRFVNTSDKSFSIGLIIGAMPLLHSALPFPFSHLAFLALIGLCLRFKTISNPPLMACGATSIALAVVAALSLTLNHDFPPHPTAPISAKEQHQGPDVILISIDTLRADAIFSNQDLGLELPTLAKLRKESMWADYALSSSNQTLPGHLGMLSGLSATSHGVRSNRDLPDPSIPLAAELFAIKGYQTAAVISNALLSSATGMHRGFSHFSDEPIGLARMSLIANNYVAQHSWISMFSSGGQANRWFRSWFYRHRFQSRSQADHCVEIALQQLDSAYQSKAPVFQFIHLMDPHTNYAPPSDIRGTVSGPLATQISTAYLPNPTAEISLDLVRKVQTNIQKGEDESALAAAYYHQVYLEEVIEVDAQLQRILAKLENSGRPFVLLLTADHGEQFAEHGLMDHANSLYEENIRVPFILFGPDIKAGKIDGVPQLCDVVPTLLSRAGIEYDSTAFDGQPIGLRVMPRPHVAVDQKEIAVRSAAAHKWIGAWQNADELPLGVKLFDISEGEHQNLIGHYSQYESEFRDLIDFYLENDTYASRQANATTSAAQQAALSSLGYADQEDDR